MDDDDIKKKKLKMRCRVLYSLTVRWTKSPAELTCIRALSITATLVGAPLGCDDLREYKLDFGPLTTHCWPCTDYFLSSTSPSVGAFAMFSANILTTVSTSCVGNLQA